LNKSMRPQSPEMIVSIFLICWSKLTSVGFGIGRPDHKGTVAVVVPVGTVEQPVQRFQRQQGRAAPNPPAEVLVFGPLLGQFKEHNPHWQHNAKSTEFVSVGIAVAPAVGQLHSPRMQQYGNASVLVGCETGIGNTTPLLVVFVIGNPDSNTGIVTVPLTVLEIGTVGQGFDFLLDAAVRENWVVPVPKVGVEVGRIGVGIHTVPLWTFVIGNVVAPVAHIGIRIVPLKLIPIGVVGIINIEVGCELSEPVRADDPPDTMFPPLETVEAPPDTLLAELEEPPRAFEEPGAVLLPPPLEFELWIGKGILPADVDESPGVLDGPGTSVEPIPEELGDLVKREELDDPEARMESTVDEPEALAEPGVFDELGAFAEPESDAIGALVEPGGDEPVGMVNPGAFDDPGACVELAADGLGTFVEPTAEDVTEANQFPTDVA
jgi:hypothetical protein